MALPRPPPDLRRCSGCGGGVDGDTGGAFPKGDEDPPYCADPYPPPLAPLPVPTDDLAPKLPMPVLLPTLSPKLPIPVLLPKPPMPVLLLDWPAPRALPADV